MNKYAHTYLDNPDIRRRQEQGLTEVKLARNRAYAQEHFGIGRIAAMYGGLYERLYDGKRQ